MKKKGGADDDPESFFPKEKEPINTRICRDCREEKPLTDGEFRFYKAGYFDGRCLPCERDHNRKRMNAAYAANPQKQLARDKASRERRKAEDPEGYSLHMRNKTFKARYGMTLEEVEAIRAAQDDKCAACGDKMGTGQRGGHIDHCHKSGKVRAMLCANCNKGLGLMKDDPQRVANLLTYILKHA